VLFGLLALVVSVVLGIRSAPAAEDSAEQAEAGRRGCRAHGRGMVASALAAGLVDEVILHQVPVLLGGGRPFFRELPGHIRLRLVGAVAAPGVTHLHYTIER
jgi:dihydrofolate reductase